MEGFEGLYVVKKLSLTGNYFAYSYFYVVVLLYLHMIIFGNFLGNGMKLKKFTLPLLAHLFHPASLFIFNFSLNYHQV